MQSKLRFVVVSLFVTSPAFADLAVDFNRDIRPILSRHCFACHGPDDESREAELRLDTAQGATADLGGYHLIEAGKPDESQLINRIESDDPDVVMPPPDSGHELSDEDRRLLREWIAAGGQYDVHWSFTLPRKMSLPDVTQADWPRHAIDHFVLAKLESLGLSPSTPSDRYQWIRRVSLDLTGLPPTPEEADQFVADGSDDAYEKVVDRLLDSDAFGEHWARMWLDLARYADTRGYEKDRPREMWRYRDWVIEALNRDMPFDRFTIEQLAGDLLENPTTEQQLATAFHRNTMTNDEGGTDNEEYRVAAVKDRVDTTIQVWMGLTMGCAKCHSHKYDPISQRDYYSFYEFFNQTEDADRNDDSPLLPSPSRDQKTQIASLEAKIQSLQQEFKLAPEGFQDAYQLWHQQFESAPLWRPLRQAGFQSQHGVILQQQDDAVLVAHGEQPDKDSWTLTLDLPESETLTALRLDVLTKEIAGGDWPDRNVALRELSVEVIEPEREPKPLKLKGARADFSQAGWPVEKAIDGKSNVGWALSPEIGKPHAAVFDFETPIQVKPGMQLRLTLEQQHGGQLLLARFRVSVSTHESKLLLATVDPETGLQTAFRQHEFAATKAIYETLESTRKQLAEVRATIPNTPVMRELSEKKRRETRIHNRGNFLDPGDPVESAVPELFGQLPPDVPRNRLGVANWLMQPDNPLTARVMVNRVWARLFGVGIVETEEDFGSQGIAPTHPQLLDWLAVDFRDHGWSLKRLIRSLVLSATYRQSSAVTQQKLDADPGNRWFTRGPRFRLPAETVRDQALAVSGLLTRRVGGPSVMPPQPAGVWKTTYSDLKWQTAADADRYRRGLYTYWKRTSPYPAMTTFDAGSGEVCQIRRVRTNTPLQALVTLNDPAFVEAAGALAKQMSEVNGNLTEQLHRGFRLVLTRPPADEETSRLIALYASMRAEFASDQKAANKLTQAAGGQQGDAALVAVANVLLNLDETLMKP